MVSRRCGEQQEVVKWEWRDCERDGAIGERFVPVSSSAVFRRVGQRGGLNPHRVTPVVVELMVVTKKKV